MVEDKSFNAFLKEKLEEECAIPEVRFPRHPKPSWRYPLLMAASLAVVCGFFCARGLIGGGGTDERRVSAAIMLLEECGGVVASSDSGDESFSERLLAWQDAPFDEVAGM